ncbi:hypothetical protein [Nocardia fluminea]|uniref:hypothetical protein n=1 Tax=Nocardia fluminea TaxID=134984 RepID=UPI003655C8E0
MLTRMMRFAAVATLAAMVVLIGFSIATDRPTVEIVVYAATLAILTVITVLALRRSRG